MENEPSSLDVYIDAVHPPCMEAEQLCQTAATAAYAFVPEKLVGRVTIRLTNDTEVQTLNRDFRHKDKPTNVLSFPDGTLDDDNVTYLGDIVLAAETVQHEAEEQGKKVADHLVHLVIHGLLHLVGYDHMNDEDEKAMQMLEIQILQTLAIENPYE